MDILSVFSSGTRRVWATAAAHPVAVLMVVFFLALLPVLPSPFTYFGDEHFYTDGAICMLDTGDFLTPRYPDGSWRFNKPVLTYWFAALSYRLFGIHFLSSRLPCLLAGCLVIGLTFGIARAMLGQRREAGVAALMMFSNFQLLTTSVRITPDIFQLLFITLSLYGFVRIIFAGSRSGWDYVWAYVGAGLALGTKGLSGLLPVAFVFLFRLLPAGRKIPARHLVRWPAVLAGLLAGVAWYAVMYLRHGNVAIQHFLHDQLADPMQQENNPYPVLNALYYGRGIFQTLLPWSLVWVMGLPWFGRSTRDIYRRHRTPFLFAFGWFVFLAAVFSLGHVVRTRYLLPVCPVLVVPLAAWITGMLDAGGKAARVPSILLGGAAVLCAIGGLAAIAAGALLGWRVSAAGMLLAVCTLVAWLGASGPTGWPQLARLAALVVALFVIGQWIRAGVGGNPTVALAQEIRQRGASIRGIVGVNFPGRYSGPLRVLLGGRMPVRLAEGRRLPAFAEGEALIISIGDVDRIDLDQFDMASAGFEYGKLGMKDVQRVLSAADRRAALEALKKPWFLAVPRRVGD